MSAVSIAPYITALTEYAQRVCGACRRCYSPRVLSSCLLGPCIAFGFGLPNLILFVHRTHVACAPKCCFGPRDRILVHRKAVCGAQTTRSGKERAEISAYMQLYFSILHYTFLYLSIHEPYQRICCFFDCARAGFAGSMSQHANHREELLKGFGMMGSSRRGRYVSNEDGAAPL